jgi:NADH-quinone oxidoreductase subunit C
MTQEEFFKTIQKYLEDNLVKAEVTSLNDQVTIVAAKNDLLDLIIGLRDSKDLRFTILTDLFGADFPEREKRFEVVYNLLSLKINKRIYVKVNLAENEDINSVASIYNAATWYEREVFDMYGIIFKNNPDLRRILTDYGFQGHPLRKDFPLTGHVEVSYDPELEKVIYKPVVLQQEYRGFDFLSPWQGTDYILPGDEKARKETAQEKK